MTRDYQTLRNDIQAAAARLNELLLEAAGAGFYVRAKVIKYSSPAVEGKARRVEARVYREA